MDGIRGTMESDEKGEKRKEKGKKKRSRRTLQREYNTEHRTYTIERNDEKFAATERASRDERTGGKEKRRGWRGLRLLRFTMGRTIGIRSRGLMIPMDVFERPCVGRAGFVL